VTSDTTPLISQASAWLNHDPDPVTRQEMEALLERVESGDDAAVADLVDRFSGHLTFGTAGLRGALGAGPMRMNRVVVAHAAHGLGRYLLERTPDGTSISVAIGADARTNSDVFARDTAEILSGMGIRARLIAGQVPTPVLAFAVKHLDADAGVMVTASHNPPQDNGYKVYLGGEDRGSQIVSPTDRDIHAHIMDSHNTVVYGDIPRSGNNVELVGPELIDQYIRHTASILPADDVVDRTALRICYTPLHGVGAAVFLPLLKQTGFASPVVVQQQVDPDPTFPTVAFPNPEEAGALDLSFAAATTHSCDLIIAHDPDADRLAVAVPNEESESGWGMLSGNDLGVLLLADVAERAHREGKKGTLACSIVSTPMISRLAERNGLTFVATPTGFKWISRPLDLLAGFEEAIGYLINPETVRDKDGISAGLAVIHLAHRLHAEGKMLTDRLHDIADAYGAWASDTISLRLPNNHEVDRLMEAIRSRPASLTGPLQASTVTDYQSHPPEGFPATNLLEIHTDGGRLIVRPSGTEPKLKIYLDAVSDQVDGAHSAVSLLAKTARHGLDTLQMDGEGMSWVG
jgi:phosphomannomutase